MKIGAFLCDIMAGVENGRYADIYEAAKAANKAGITAVDLPLWMIEKYGFNPEELADKLKKIGIEITSVHYNVNCDYTDKNSINKGVQELKKAMELATKTTAKNFMIILSPLDFFDFSKQEAFKAEVRRVMPELVDYCCGLGLTPTIENYSLPIYPYSTIEDIKWLMDNNPSLMFNYDSGNFTCSEIDEVEGAAAFAGRTVHAHIKDWLGPPLINGIWAPQNSLAIGKGTTPNKEALKVLKDNGYNGAVIIEICPPKDDMFAELLDSAKELRKIFNEIGA